MVAFVLVTIKPEHKIAVFTKKWFPFMDNLLGKAAFIYFIISVLSDANFVYDIVIASLCYASALPLLLLGCKEMKEAKANNANPNVQKTNVE